MRWTVNTPFCVLALGVMTSSYFLSSPGLGSFLPSLSFLSLSALSLSSTFLVSGSSFFSSFLSCAGTDQVLKARKARASAPNRSAWLRDRKCDIETSAGVRQGCYAATVEVPDGAAVRQGVRQENDCAA